MEANSIINAAFDLDVVSVRLSNLIETNPRVNYRKLLSYQSILASIKDVGILQPISIYPAKQKGKYKIIEGHLRYYALKELKEKEIDCIIAHDDERYTQEAKVNYINPIQRAKMFSQAFKSGVDIDRMAKALNIDKKKILLEIKASDGVDNRTREILKTAPVSTAVLRSLAKVKPIRQIQIAECMVNANNYTIHFATGLVMSSHSSLMYDEKPKKPKNYVSADLMSCMTKEQSNIQSKIKEIRIEYNKNICETKTLASFIESILSNNILNSFLKRNYEKIYHEFLRIVQNEIAKETSE